LRVFIMAAAFALSVLVGLSRIYLGVHWPSDVLAGWCLGPRTGRLSWMQFRTVDPAHAAPTSIK
jgi:undecaprenyl-diphosphatase